MSQSEVKSADEIYDDFHVVREHRVDCLKSVEDVDDAMLRTWKSSIFAYKDIFVYKITVNLADSFEQDFDDNYEKYVIGE